MADNDLAEEFKAVGDAVKNLARKVDAISGDEVKSFLEAVKTKVSEFEKLLDAQRAKNKSDELARSRTAVPCVGSTPRVISPPAGALIARLTTRTVPDPGHSTRVPIGHDRERMPHCRRYMGDRRSPRPSGGVLRLIIRVIVRSRARRNEQTITRMSSDQ